MIRFLRPGGVTIESVDDPDAAWRLPADAVWIDLVRPSIEEEHLVENQLGLLLPTREDMVEIEASSRVYHEDGASFMTALLLINSASERPTTDPVTFVLTGERLITIRYADPTSFELFESQLDRTPCIDGLQIFLGLLETIVDRAADILESAGSEVEAISHEVFDGKPQNGFRKVLKRLGRAQSMNGKIRESLVSLTRILGFSQLAPQVAEDQGVRERLRGLARDVASITDHATYQAGQGTFLLDAALGQINIEQNDIIKIFSVASVAFLPPTLIASIYGMNFHHMPELDWPWGYPLAVAAMVLSAALPLWWFKRRGWL